MKLKSNFISFLRNGIWQNTVSLTYSMEESPSWKAYSHSTSQETPQLFIEPRRFSTVFTRARHWSVSRAICIQSTPSHPVFLRKDSLRCTHFISNIFMWLILNRPVPMAESSETRTAFGRSNTGIIGSNPAWGMDVCPRFFFLCCVVLCVVTGLSSGRSPRPRSPTNCPIDVSENKFWTGTDQEAKSLKATTTTVVVRNSGLSC
jgi:hypothetical protein